MDWKDAKNNPPKTTEGCWSRTVVVMTNYGNVNALAYYGTKEEGCWQRPLAFGNGEVVEHWIEKPWNLEQEDNTCKHCGGRGGVRIGPPCSYCDGEGFVIAPNEGLDPCPACKGTCVESEGEG
jgi:DnaJ-class molecular chaperone